MKRLLCYMILSYTIIIASESFSAKDWQLVCDNTHTCRLAGYTDQTLNQEYYPISILLEREAGASTRINGYIELDYTEYTDKLKNDILKMSIGNKIYVVNVSKKLKQLHTDILVNALAKEKEILFLYGDKYKWVFSQSGSFASMLKMDDYQKRIDTIGAIYKKGNKNENNVLKSKSIPIVNVPEIYPILENKKIPELTLATKNRQLLQDLLSVYYEDIVNENTECWTDKEEARKSLKVYRLTDKLAIASQVCWIAAYNFADAFWLINLKPPFVPKYITYGNSFFVDADGVASISNSHKGRGVGDCWSNNKLVWNGKDFVEILNSTTGLCRGFAGGAWKLPTLIKKVKVENSFNIKIKKVFLHSSANDNSKLKSYLLKGDRVKVLYEKKNWLYILYKGKKHIKAWIPKSSVVK